MKKYFIIFLMAMLPTLALAQQAGQHITRPSKPATTTTKPPKKQAPPKKQTTPKPPKKQTPPPKKQPQKQKSSKNQATIRKQSVVSNSNQTNTTVQYMEDKLYLKPVDQNHSRTNMSQSNMSVDDDKVYRMVEQMPSYPGGDAGLLQDVADNLEYPEIAQMNGTQGRVVLQFIVTKYGTVGEVRVVRPLSPECDQAAIKAVKRLKKFNPGRQNGNAVNVWYTLPVTFKLQT